MKRTIPAFFISVLIFAFLSPFQIIEVNRHGQIYRVNTTEIPVNESGALSIARTTELATQALSANIVDLKTEKNETDQEVIKHVEEVDLYVRAKSALTNDINVYVKDVENHNWGADQHKVKLAEHNAAVAASNALAADKRDPANVSHLNSQKIKLDTWANEITNSKSRLDQKRYDLGARNSQLNSDHARLNQENTRLQSKYNSILSKLGLAYQQLQALVKYAKTINAGIASNQWRVNKISDGVLFGSDELIKESSNFIFDGNKKEQQLKTIVPPLVIKSN